MAFSDFFTVQTHKLKRALGGFGAGGKQEGFFKLRGGVLNEHIDELYALAGSIGIGMQQGTVQLLTQSAHNARIGMASIGYKNSYC